MRFNLGFFLHEALKNVRLNLLMSLTAMTTTFICILVLGVAFLINAHVGGLVDSVRQDVSIEAFFDGDAGQERIDEVRGEVAGYPEVAGVTVVTQEEAVERFQETFSDQPALSESVEELPASLQIELENPGDAEAVAAKLRETGFTEENLRYPQQTIDRLNTVTGYIVWGLRGATALFLVSSVLLISNAIRLSIFARRQEIEVMKLVGASDGFVRTPFVFEGLVQSLIGALLAALVVIWANSLFVDWIQDAVPFIPISGEAVNVPLLLLVLLGLGAVIGVLGSYLSVRRFLKV